MHDAGAAQAAGKVARKNVLIFFVAKGNRDVARYEREYFTNPAVRSMMDNFVLTKVDFPSNTKTAYYYGILGAGMIAITDPVGGKVGDIVQMPPTAADFAALLDRMK